MNLNSSSAYIVQKVFKMLYFDGYSIPEIVKDDEACAIIDQMAKCKKINSFQYSAIKEILNESKDRPINKPKL